MKPPNTLRLAVIALALLVGAAALQGAPAQPPASAKSGPKSPAKPQSQPPAPAPRPDEVGMVDGIPIYQVDWDRLADPYFEEVEAKAGRKLSDDEKKLLRKNILDELIRERLWLADARRRGMVATEAAIDSRMKQNDYFKKGGKVDEAMFQRFKKSDTSNYPALKDEIQDAILLEEYVRWMERRFGPRDAELRKEFETRSSTATIRYMLMGPDAVSLDPDATPAQIRAYYDAHPDEFESADEAHIQYIRIPIGADASVPDSARENAAQAASKIASDVIAAIRTGAPAETAAKPYGGIQDPGWFKLGDPIRGIGRSEALTAAIKGVDPPVWIREPLRIGPMYMVVNVVERRRAKRLPFHDVVYYAKRKADLEVRDQMIDSLAREDVRLHPESYYAPKIEVSIVARGLNTFEPGSPPTPKEIDRRLEKLKEELHLPDSSRAYLDSTRASIPALIVQERQVKSGFHVMKDAAGKLAKKESAARVASRYGGVLSLLRTYRGQPPERASILEGKLLDSLYTMRAGAVVGPRVKDDSVYVVRLESIDGTHVPPFSEIREDARAAAEAKQKADIAREAEAWFSARGGSYRTASKYLLDVVFFAKKKPEQITVPDDSIASYWRDHPLEFTEPAKAKVRHILVRSQDATTLEAARQKALAARKRLVAGEDFAAVAREMSEDATSATRGGELGELTRGAVPKEFGDAIMSLGVGEFSDPVETKFGYHIVQVESRTPERLRPLEECKTEIRGVIADQIADSLARIPARILADRASRVGYRAADSLAAPYGGWTRKGPVGADGEIEGVGKIPFLARVVASLADSGVAAEPVELPEGDVVLRKMREEAPRQARFDEVRDKAIADYQEERKRAEADSLNTRFKAALREGADPETLFVAYGGLRPSKSFGRQGPIPDFQKDAVLGRDSTYLARIFASKPKAVLPPLTGSSGTLYGVVDTVTIPAASEFARQRDALLRQVLDERIDAWTGRLRTKAPIRMNRKDLQALVS
ncbi:MAG TPA: peptidyl-prolyl cis-trans isomerase [Candidatus Eisenbacteria bacterium]|nr:peptidyl-prolyl cis-trans isomerase [Candidatus Eisenbacteria bacterium]